MAKIADKIREWANTHVAGASAMTRNTEAYNHMQAAVQQLLAQPWAQQDVQEDPAPTPLASDSPDDLE